MPIQDPKPISLPEAAKFMRNKLHWMEGFASALDNLKLLQQVNEMRHLLNRVMKGYEDESERQPEE